MITSQKKIRELFWEYHPECTKKKEKISKDYCTDTRVTFCDFIENLSRSGHITDKMMNKVTLK